MSNALVLSTMNEVALAAKAMSASGFFSDARQEAQAVVKILAGQEMGFGPFASMTGIFIIQGRPAIGANLMAAAVKGHRKYDYRVLEMTETACEIAFLQDDKDIGHSRFTIEDARKAGTKNLDKFPRNMLFARCISNGVRWYTPDVFLGNAVYTPEELGANVNEEGQVIDVVPEPQPEQPKPLWTSDANSADKFWVWATHDMTLTKDAAFEALGVSDLTEFIGTKTDAIHLINRYIASKQAEQPTMTAQQAADELEL